MKRAEKILSDNIDKLHNLANVLLEREILDGDEIARVLRGETLPPLERKNGNGVSTPVPGVSVTTIGGPTNGGHPDSRISKAKPRSKKSG
jgi:hypothetical protein